MFGTSSGFSPTDGGAVGADDTGADPEEAGSDLDDLPDLEEDNVD